MNVLFHVMLLFSSSKFITEISALNESSMPSLFHFADRIRVTSIKDGLLIFNDEELNKRRISASALKIKEPYSAYASSYIKLSTTPEELFIFRESENASDYYRSILHGNVRHNISWPFAPSVRIARLNNTRQILIAKDVSPANCSHCKLQISISSVTDGIPYAPDYEMWHLHSKPNFLLRTLSAMTYGEYQYLLLDKPSFFRSVILLRIKGASLKKGSDHREIVSYTLSLATRGAQFFDFFGEFFFYIFTHEKESEVIRIKMDELNEILNKADDFCYKKTATPLGSAFMLVDLESYAFNFGNLEACQKYPKVTTVIDLRYENPSGMTGNILTVARDVIWIYLAGNIQKRYLIFWHNTQVYRCHDSDEPDCVLTWTFDGKNPSEFPVHSSYRLNRAECFLEMTSHEEKKGAYKSRTNPYKLKVMFLDCSLFNDCLDCELYGTNVPCVWEYDEARKSSNCKHVLSADRNSSRCLYNHSLIGVRTKPGGKSELIFNFPLLNFGGKRFKIEFKCLDEPGRKNEGEITILNDHQVKVIWPTLDESCNMRITVRFDREGGRIATTRLYYWDLTKGNLLNKF